tara:strand:- start:164 stop:508 length:345 start_codon:yes stop_codon:yes gene_type:complete
MKICPFCHEHIQLDVTKCNFCNEKIYSQQILEVDIEKNQLLKRCQFCKKEIKEKASKCYHCGKIQEEEIKYSVNENIKQINRNRWVWMFIIVFIVICFFYYLWETNSIWRGMWS